MSLQNIFEMAKADRYAADGRAELDKAREADVEDRTYQIGEISAKTGLQKTANGWVKPRAESNPAASKSPEESFKSTKPAGTLEKGKIFVDRFGGDGSLKVDEVGGDGSFSYTITKADGSKASGKASNEKELRHILSTNGYGEAAETKGADVSLASKDVKEVAEKIKPSDGAEKAELSKITQFMDEEKSSLKNAIEGRESFYKNTKNPTPEQEAGLAALLRIKNKIGKQPDTGLSGEKKTVSYREMGEGPLYVKKEASDSAPRALTGDCKIRVKK